MHCRGIITVGNGHETLLACKRTPAHRPSGWREKQVKILLEVLQPEENRRLLEIGDYRREAFNGRYPCCFCAN